MEIKLIVESAISSLCSNCSIETTMLKAQSIAYLLKDETFIWWVNCEQNGYSDEDKLPSYRIVGCQVKVDISQPFVRIVKNYSFPPGILGKYDDRLFHMNIFNPITEIERFSASDGQLNTEVFAAIYPEMNKYINGSILNARQIISPANLTSIITNVKSRLLNFFLKLNDELNMNIDLTKLENKKKLLNIMNQTIYAGVVNTGSGSIDIKKSNIVEGTDNKLIINENLKELILNLLEDIKYVNFTSIDDNQDAKVSIDTIQSEIEKENYNPGNICRALKVLKAIPSVVATHGLEMLIDQIFKLLTK